MRIRLGDGNEVVTPLDLQRRIIDRMAYEKKMRQEEEVGGQPGKGSQKTQTEELNGGSAFFAGAQMWRDERNLSR
jgi:hypothetical protein